MISFFKKIIATIKTKYHQFRELKYVKFFTTWYRLDGNQYLPASLTFYVILSLIPLLTLFVLLLSVLNVPTSVINTALKQLIVDEELFKNLQVIVDYLETITPSAMVALGISSLVSIYVASRGVEAFINFSDSLLDYNFLKVHFMTRKIRSVIMTFFVVFGVDIVIAFLVFNEALLSYFVPVQFVTVIGYLKLPILFTTFFFALATIMMFGPSKRQKFHEVWPGCLFASTSIALALFGFLIYVSYFNDYSNIYGPISSIIIMLLIFYFSSYLLLMGVTLNKIVKDYLIKHPKKKKGSGSSEKLVADENIQLSDNEIESKALIDSEDLTITE